MYWYKNLYFGDNAKEKSKELIRALRHKKWIPEVYVVTVSETSGNLLDIYESTRFVTGRPIRKTVRRIAEKHTFKGTFFHKTGPYIVGIAIGYAEALALVQNIIEDVYRNTGGFDVAGYFGLE